MLPELSLLLCSPFFSSLLAAEELVDVTTVWKTAVTGINRVTTLERTVFILGVWS